MTRLPLKTVRRLGDVLPNDPDPCAPRVHPVNDPLYAEWLPLLMFGATVLGVILLARSGKR